MDKINIEKEFKEKVCKEIHLLEEGVNRYRIFTPFQFEDGDHLSIVLKKMDEVWFLTDEGHTFMHLSYDMDVNILDNGPRAKIISNVLSNFNVSEKNGAIISYLNGKGNGNVFYNYVQALIKISDISYLNKERVKSTFMDDFKNFIISVVPIERIKFNYIDPKHDVKGLYPVDIKINGMPKPLFVFGINSDGKCRDTTISLQQYERWNLNFKSLSIFEDQETISRNVLARFSDVCEKQFSNLSSNRERLAKYLSESISEN